MEAISVESRFRYLAEDVLWRFQELLEFRLSREQGSCVTGNLSVGAADDGDGLVELR